jgi:DNA-binding CsgD family transcriptional regulator/tetratricopeptide (TPR) repeat protein
VAPQTPLLDRERETGLIASAVADAVGGHGRLLVVEGESGIGKTRLLAYVRQLAGESGLAVLSARGSELEREFAFGLVRQLFEPALAAAGAEERDRLLAGSAAGAAQVFDGEVFDGEVFDGEVFGGAGPTAAAELPTLHGLYWLTVNACRRPTAVLIDDLHWSDAGSLRYLTYLLPRLEDLPVLVAAVLRAGERVADPLLVQGLLADPATTAVRPGPLGPEAVHALLRAQLAGEVDAGFADSCRVATAGNPLLLHAVAGAMARDRIEPVAANRKRVAEFGPQAVARQVSLRVARLPASTRAVARAAAVLGPGARLVAVARLADVDLLTALDAAEELAGLGLVEMDEPPAQRDQVVSFSHPLVGAAVHAELTSRERALAHARAADVLAGLGDDERAAAHLLKTAPGLNDRAVPWLRRAAAAAAGRGSPEAAFAFLRRCLDEELPREERFALLREAATVAVQVDLPEAVRLFEEAYAYPDRPAERARIAAQLGVAYGYLLDPDRACEALFEALRLTGDDDPDLRRRLEATLLVAVFVAPGRRTIAERVPALAGLPPADGLGARMLEAAIACHEMATGDPYGSGRARAALADGLLVRAANGEGALVCGWLTLLAADDPAALASIEEAVRQAHLDGSLRALAPAYTFRALGRLWTGQLADAESDAREALRLAETGRVDMDVSFAGAYLAEALIEQGRLGEAADTLRRIGVPADLSPARPRYYALDAYAKLLRLTGGEGALDAALAAARAWQEYGFDNPAPAGWRSEAALVHFGRNRVDDAVRIAGEELAGAERWGAPRARGRALRVLGLVTGDPDRLRESVAVLEGTPARLEYARSLADLGAALRRAGRRTDARDALARALDAAEVCGAAPLVERAAAELRTAGFRPRRHRLVGAGALTPSERRVAEIAAGGASNREIAQALFVTTKTVEVHLTSAYRKLGVNRRGELARQLAGD